jgi:hypothetical protein
VAATALSSWYLVCVTDGALSLVGGRAWVRIAVGEAGARAGQVGPYRALEELFEYLRGAGLSQAEGRTSLGAGDLLHHVALRRRTTQE